MKKYVMTKENCVPIPYGYSLILEKPLIDNNELKEGEIQRNIIMICHTTPHETEDIHLNIGVLIEQTEKDIQTLYSLFVKSFKDTMMLFLSEPRYFVFDVEDHKIKFNKRMFDWEVK